MLWIHWSGNKKTNRRICVNRKTTQPKPRRRKKNSNVRTSDFCRRTDRTGFLASRRDLFPSTLQIQRTPVLKNPNSPVWQLVLGTTTMETSERRKLQMWRAHVWQNRACQTCKDGRWTCCHAGTAMNLRATDRRVEYSLERQPAEYRAE